MAEIVANHVQLNKLSEATYRKLNTVIGENIRQRAATAAAVAVFHEDTPMLDAAWGWTDPHDKQFPVHVETFFDLASLTKLYTATAFFTLVTEEKVSLHTPLVEVIPEFGHYSPRPINGGQDPFTKEYLALPTEFKDQTVDPSKVTFFHLLYHTSGLPPWRDVYTVADAPVEPPRVDPIEREERWSWALERLCNYEFVGQPDSIVRYSDIGSSSIGIRNGLSTGRSGCGI
jgi:CubicO group peptidase (beta-lactamase class C family)